MKTQFFLYAFILLISNNVQAQNFSKQDIEQLEKKMNHAIQTVVDYVRGYKYFFEVNQIDTQFVSSTNQKLLKIGGNLQYRIDQQIAVGGMLNYQQNSNESENSSHIAIYGLGTYFFQSDVLNSFYTQLALGVYNSSELSTMQSSFVMSVGKQMQVFERITYSPKIQILKNGNNNSVYEIYPLSLSVWF